MGTLIDLSKINPQKYPKQKKRKKLSYRRAYLKQKRYLPAIRCAVCGKLTTKWITYNDGFIRQIKGGQEILTPFIKHKCAKHTELKITLTH